MFKQTQIANRLTKEHIALFRAKLQSAGPDGCWLWQGAKRTDGYGVVRIAGIVLKSHRVAWVIATGCDIREGQVIDHTCFNKACCNPAHLRETSQTDNVYAYQKSRSPVSSCIRGHQYDRGKPCRECNRLRQAAWKQSRRRTSTT